MSFHMFYGENNISVNTRNMFQMLFVLGEKRHSRVRKLNQTAQRGLCVFEVCSHVLNFLVIGCYTINIPERYHMLKVFRVSFLFSYNKAIDKNLPIQDLFLHSVGHHSLSWLLSVQTYKLKWIPGQDKKTNRLRQIFSQRHKKNCLYKFSQIFLHGQFYKMDNQRQSLTADIKIQIPICCPCTFPIKAVTRSC